jgi:hypothetical protein
VIATVPMVMKIRTGYSWLLALAAVGCSTAQSAAPKANIDWQQPADVKPTLLVHFVGLALFDDERVEANALVAAWATSRGWQVVDPGHARKVLSRARAGLDPRTGTACGLPLSERAGTVRWMEVLGAQGLLGAFVACEGGACRLRVKAFDSADGDLNTLADLAAPFDTSLPWRDALTRALGALVQNQDHRVVGNPVGGLGIKGHGRSSDASARPSQLTFSTSSASALDSRELFQGAVSLSSTGMSSLRACFDDSGSAELLVAIDDLGRVARCESRNADDAAAACACNACWPGESPGR